MTYTEAGFREWLDAMGYIDPVRAYQRDAGLSSDGILGPQTRSALIADRAARAEPQLRDFRGSLGPLVRFEGHRGRPYYPGGASGVTLDPGWDLANGRDALAFELYGPIFGAVAMDALRPAFGLRGEDAAEWVEEWWSSLGRWSIERETAARILPACAGPYWSELCRATDGLIREAPGSVQSALLSVTYNAWSGWVRGVVLDSLRMGLWAALADQVAAIPGGHAGRRQLEAGMIRSA